ncbi:MAG: SPOR domain-containing protein [Epsilonproteobacteria bacterium]|nr:SPOR domain-containing protein [Campylobacterota bacterium]
MLRFIIFLFPIYLFASYEIVVASLKHKEGIEKIKREFPSKKLNVYNKNGMKIVALGDFPDKKEAMKFLTKVKKRYPSAFIRAQKRENKQIDSKSSNKTYLIQIAALSKKENLHKIENKFSSYDITYKKSNDLYKIYARFKNREEALRALRNIKKSFPSAFLVGEKISTKSTKKESKNQKYIIFLGAFKNNLDKALIDLIDEESYVKKDQNVSYLYIVNIPSKEIADKKLSLLKQKYPNAKIVSSLNEKIELPNNPPALKMEKENENESENNQTELQDRNISIPKNIQKPTKSIETNQTDTNIIQNSDEENRTIQEVMSREIKELKEDNKNQESKEVETQTKKYEPPKEEISPFNSKTIIKIRKNYVDFEK